MNYALERFIVNSNEMEYLDNNSCDVGSPSQTLTLIRVDGSNNNKDSECDCNDNLLTAQDESQTCCEHVPVDLKLAISVMPDIIL